MADGESGEEKDGLRCAPTGPPYEIGLAYSD